MNQAVMLYLVSSRAHITTILHAIIITAIIITQLLLSRLCNLLSLYLDMQRYKLVVNHSLLMLNSKKWYINSQTATDIPNHTEKIVVYR
jgi:hypothetical protein